MRKRKQPVPKDWYKSREALCLFILLGLIALALSAGLFLLIIRHPFSALIAAGGAAAAAAAGYGIYRIADGLKWKRDLKRFDKVKEALKTIKEEK